MAGLAFVTTMLAPAATLVVWTILDAVRTGKPTAVGCRHGDRRRPGGRHAGGRLRQPDERARARRDRRGSELLRRCMRAKTSLDDSLDVVAAHGVGGTVGALLTGVFAQKALNGVARRRAVRQPGAAPDQGAAVLGAMVYSGVVSFVLLKLIGSGDAAARDRSRKKPTASTSPRTAKRRMPRRVVRRRPRRLWRVRVPSSSRLGRRVVRNAICWRWRAEARATMFLNPRAQRRQSMFVTDGVRRSALAVVAAVGVMVVTSAPAFAGTGSSERS